MSQDTAWLPSEIAEQLTELKSWVRWQWLLRGVGRVGLIASLGLAGAFIADYRYDLAPTTRIAVLSSVVAVTLIAFLGWVVLPLCRRIGWAELAAMADKANPRWEGALTSAVELFDPSQPDGFKGSPVMREMLLKQTRQRIEELDLEEVVSSRKAWSSVRLGLASCVMLSIPVFVAPSMYRQLWQRFLMPWGNWATAGAWTVDVVNGDRIVARGTDVELLATAEKDGQAEPPKSLTLEWRDSAGTTDRRAMPFDEARKSFVAVVPHVMRDFDFRIAVERQKSRDYKIQVVEPPVVTKIRLEVEPPAYAGWPAQSLDGAIGAIKVFERSRLKFTLEFNKPVETAQLVWRQHGDANKWLELAGSKQAATLEVTADPNVAGPFLFALEDIHKLPNNDTVPRELVIVTDEAPKLTVKGDHSTEARPDDVVPIDVTASDDVGLGTLELHLTIEEKLREPIVVEAVRGQKNFEHRFTLDLSQLNVEHGQWLNYRVRITDERPEPGPHEVWSEPRVLRISKKAAPPGANELAKSHEQLRDELNSLRRDIVAKGNEIADLRKEAAQENRQRSKDDPSDAERIALLEQQLQRLTARTEQLAQQLSQDPLFHELGEKAEQIAQNELKNAETEVQQSRAEADQPLNKEQLDHLNQAENQLDSAAKQLTQLEKPFAQLADLQKDLLELRRLARQAEQLANRADELAKNEANRLDASARARKDAGDEKQAAANAAKAEVEKQQLADQQKQLADGLDDLLKRRPELLAAARRDQLERLGELAEEARLLAEQQKELADGLRQQQEAAAERNAALAEKQQELQERVQAATEKAVERDESRSVKPANTEPLEVAAAALKQGDLAEAQKQQQQAVNELERLAAELQQAKANQSPLAQAARELANEQKKLADKAAAANKSDEAEQRQLAAEQLKREQAALNERIENLPQGNNPADKPADPDATKPNAAQAARQDAEQRGAQAEQAFADGNLELAAQEQRRVEEALRELGKQAAQQPMPNAQAKAEPGNAAPIPNGAAPQENAKPNEPNRDPAANELVQLAEEQRQLAQEVAQALNERRGQQPPNAAQPPAANEQANAKNANEPPMPANGQQPAGENAPPNQPPQGNPPQPPNAGEPPNAARPQDNPGQNPQAQQPGQKPEPQVGQQAQDARAAQQELAQQAQEIQKQVRQELGPDSPEAKQAQAAAEQAQASQRQANSGEFDKAAERGKQAAESDEKLAEQLQNNPRANPELAQQAAKLAEQQQAVAQKMEQLAQQPAAKNAAQQQRQQELNNAAGELGQQLAESQNRLEQQPLNLPQQAEGAKQAGQEAANSQQNMEAAKQAAQQGDANQAAQKAEQAAENLQQAAQQAQAAAERNPPPESPIPRGVGEEVVEAAERLRQAAQARQEANQQAQAPAQQNDQPMPAQPMPAQPMPGQPMPGQPMPGQPMPGQPMPGQPMPGQPMPGQPMPGQPMPGQPMPGQPMPGQPMPGQPMPGQGQGQGQGQGEAQSPGQSGQGQAPGQGQGQSAQSGQGQSSGQGQQGQSQGMGQGQSQGQGNGQGQSPGQGQGAPSSAAGETAKGPPLAQAARRLREAARALSDAADQSAPLPSQGGQPQSGEPSKDPNGNPKIAQAGGGGSGQGNVEQDRGENVGDLQAQVKKMTGRNWGQLSSKLKTELSQQAKHQAHGDYSKLIKLYFQEIAKTQPDAEEGKR